MDKFKLNNKIKYMIILISVIALISGVLFTYILKDIDKKALEDSIKTFIESIGANTYNYSYALKSHLLVNLGYIIGIWLLGISIIGFPIIIFLYFSKIFTLGITISGLIGSYSMKGIIYSFIYLFPHNIINILLYALISIKSLTYSYKVFKSFIKKESIKINIDKRLFLMCIIGVLITSLYGTYIMPYVFKILLKIIK